MKKLKFLMTLLFFPAATIFAESMSSTDVFIQTPIAYKPVELEPEASKAISEAKNFESKGKWISALGSYAAAMSADSNASEALENYNSILEAINEGKPGKGEFDDFSLYDGWIALLQDAEEYFSTHMFFDFDYTAPEKGEADYKTRTYTYSFEVDARRNSFYNKVISSLTKGLEKSWQNNWDSIPQSWPAFSVFKDTKTAAVTECEKLGHAGDKPVKLFYFLPSWTPIAIRDDGEFTNQGGTEIHDNIIVNIDIVTNDESKRTIASLKDVHVPLVDGYSRENGEPFGDIYTSYDSDGHGTLKIQTQWRSEGWPKISIKGIKAADAKILENMEDFSIHFSNCRVVVEKFVTNYKGTFPFLTPTSVTVTKVKEVPMQYAKKLDLNRIAFFSNMNKSFQFLAEKNIVSVSELKGELAELNLNYSDDKRLLSYLNTASKIFGLEPCYDANNDFAEFSDNKNGFKIFNNMVGRIDYEKLAEYKNAQAQQQEQEAKKAKSEARKEEAKSLLKKGKKKFGF